MSGACFSGPLSGPLFARFWFKKLPKWSPDGAQEAPEPRPERHQNRNTKMGRKGYQNGCQNGRHAQEDRHRLDLLVVQATASTSSLCELLHQTPNFSMLLYDLLCVWN